ncbi:RhuM family protein [Rhodopseudomonas sp. B29]|uniref:RhuM family protein n=1 Tax=Rhodopseudomonas sp. B29 TaxID=95607 RepID=UPI0003B5A305|nr:RhuM family protein [Rhodopseudomonas sp. B29]
MAPLPTEPVHLVEDAATGDRFLIYRTDRGIKVELRYEGETLWMSQAQIADLFGVSRQMVNAHVNNIYQEGELDRQSTCKESLQVRDEGGRQVNRKTLIHNLDTIIAVGYRVSSKQGTLFRRWATEKLVQFATKGFVIDAEQLKAPDSRDRVAELKEIIRDIRSDEANVYREIKRICAMCSDYDPKSAAWQTFYAHTQAKLMYAVTAHTPSEMVQSRANADHPNMGLRTWKGGNITKADVDISKNYLAEGELREFNRLTVILLDIFEDQLDLGKINTMAEIEALLDNQLKSLNRSLLRGGGSVKAEQAKVHALEQYELFNAKRKAIRFAEADAALKALRAEEKSLPRPPRRTPPTKKG